MINDEDQLLNMSESAKLKGISVQMFAYYLGRGRAPKPVIIGQHSHRFFYRDEVKAWTVPKKRKG